MHRRPCRHPTVRSPCTNQTRTRRAPYRLRIRTSIKSHKDNICWLMLTAMEGRHHMYHMPLLAPKPQYARLLCLCLSRKMPQHYTATAAHKTTTAATHIQERRRQIFQGTAALAVPRMLPRIIITIILTPIPQTNPHRVGMCMCTMRTATQVPITIQITMPQIMQCLATTRTTPL